MWHPAQAADGASVPASCAKLPVFLALMVLSLQSPCNVAPSYRSAFMNGSGLKPNDFRRGVEGLVRANPMDSPSCVTTNGASAKPAANRSAKALTRARTTAPKLYEPRGHICPPLNGRGWTA